MQASCSTVHGQLKMNSVTSFAVPCLLNCCVRAFTFSFLYFIQYLKILLFLFIYLIDCLHIYYVFLFFGIFEFTNKCVPATISISCAFSWVVILEFVCFFLFWSVCFIYYFIVYYNLLEACFFIVSLVLLCLFFPNDRLKVGGSGWEGKN